MSDGSSFWYTEGVLDNNTIFKVNPKTNTKTLLFDTARLRQILTVLSKHESPYKGIPFEEFAFVEGEKVVKFTVENKDFILQLDTYSITQVPVLSEEEQRRLVLQITRKETRYPDMDLIEICSPDGRWLKDRNVWLRSTVDGKRVQFTTDGKEGYAYRDSPEVIYPKTRLFLNKIRELENGR